jgi:hypothetical protein
MEKSRNRSFVVALSLLVLGLAASSGQLLYGQSTFGSVLGNVMDVNRAVIPGVPVTLTNQNTNVTRKATTNEAGIFEFLDLVPGVYRLEANKEGFKTFVKGDIELTARQIIRINPVMELGTLTETVTVEATPGLIATETSTVSGTVQGGEAFFLSPNSTTQRPWALMRLDPLVQNTNSSTRFTMAGAYYSQSEFQIDGISAPLGSGRLATSMVMSSEALQEVSIQAVNNKAEYASPGVFQQISKGGTNAWHGDVFWHFSSSALNAQKRTDTTKPASHDHRFGGNIGGPIVIPGLYDGHNRTFFSLSWQSTRNPGGQTYTTDVPTLDMRQGIFSQTINNPFNGLPFTNNTIPPSMINPVSRFFQETFYPKPTSSGASSNHQIVGPTGTTREEVVDLRIDQHVSSKHWMYGRVGGTQFNNRGYDSSLPTMGFRARTRKLYTGTVSYTYTILPTLLNELRLGFIRDNNPNAGSNNGLEVLRAAGIQFPSDLPAPDTRGFPVIDITGVQNLAQVNTVSNISASYQMTDTLSWIKGKHTLKGGLNIFAEQPNIARINSGVHGNFRFQGTYTNQAYADFLLGIPNRTRVVGLNPNLYMRSTNYGLFFQDDFKVRPNLTLNLGIRWDYQGPIYNKNNALYNFDPSTGGLIKAAPDTPVNTAFAAKFKNVPILEASALGLPERALRFADKNNFAPRFGFAWRPRGASTFVVRGGWGKFTDLLGQGVFELLASGGFLNRGDFDYPNAMLDKSGVLPASAFMFPYPFPAGVGGEAPASLGAGGFNPRMVNPYIQQWNLTLEKSLFDISFRTSYIGTKSTNLIYRRDINQRLIPAINSSRPYTANGFTGSIQYMDNGGSHIYHGLQFKAERRYRNGLMFQAGYVWGNSISDVIDGGDRDYTDLITDARDRSIDRGRVGFNRQHNFTATAIWELPFGRGHRLLGGAPGWLHHIVSGWQFYPQFYAASGQWFSPRRQGSNPFTNVSGETARPDRIGDGNDGPRLTGESDRMWFNTNAFSQPPGDRLGNAGRNILEGPGFWSLHFGLTKKIRFMEGKELWLGITAQNALNHPNWRTPTTTGELTVGQSAFGSTSTLLGQDRGANSASRWIMLRTRIVF